MHFNRCLYFPLIASTFVPCVVFVRGSGGAGSVSGCSGAAPTAYKEMPGYLAPGNPALAVPSEGES